MPLPLVSCRVRAPALAMARSNLDLATVPRLVCPTAHCVPGRGGVGEAPLSRLFPLADAVKGPCLVLVIECQLRCTNCVLFEIRR
jgi:hypothetical protein